jgi:hypothetical protein
MIQGMQFRFFGKEIIELMNQRVKFHKDKAAELEGDLKVAEEAMATAQAAGAKAGRPSSGRPIGRIGMAMAAPARSYGESIEDPVSALMQAIVFHTAQAEKLTFYAQHIMPEEAYMLSERDLPQYELLVVGEE